MTWLCLISANWITYLPNKQRTTHIGMDPTRFRQVNVYRQLVWQITSKYAWRCVSKRARACECVFVSAPQQYMHFWLQKYLCLSTHMSSKELIWFIFTDLMLVSLFLCYLYKIHFKKVLFAIRTTRAHSPIYRLNWKKATTTTTTSETQTI